MSEPYWKLEKGYGEYYYITHLCSRNARRGIVSKNDSWCFMCQQSVPEEYLVQRALLNENNDRFN